MLNDCKMKRDSKIKNVVVPEVLFGFCTVEYKDACCDKKMFVE